MGVQINLHIFFCPFQPPSPGREEFPRKAYRAKASRNKCRRDPKVSPVINMKIKLCLLFCAFGEELFRSCENFTLCRKIRAHELSRQSLRYIIVIPTVTNVIQFLLKFKLCISLHTHKLYFNTIPTHIYTSFNCYIYLFNSKDKFKLNFIIIITNICFRTFPCELFMPSTTFIYSSKLFGVFAEMVSYKFGLMRMYSKCNYCLSFHFASSRWQRKIIIGTNEITFSEHIAVLTSKEWLSQPSLILWYAKFHCTRALKIISKLERNINQC